jgi:hypothetical protein
MADTATSLDRTEQVNLEIAEMIEGFRNEIAVAVRSFALSMSDVSVGGCSAFCGNWQNVGPLQDKVVDIALALIVQDARFIIPRFMENYVDGMPSASMLLRADEVRGTP